jgi:outer membrane protein OmpA-like peptidoglycan-associated protein
MRRQTSGGHARGGRRSRTGLALATALLATAWADGGRADDAATAAQKGVMAATRIARPTAADAAPEPFLHILRDDDGARVIGVAPDAQSAQDLRGALARDVPGVLDDRAMAVGDADGAPHAAWPADAVAAMAGSLRIGRVSMESDALRVVGAPGDADDAARIAAVARRLRADGLQVGLALAPPLDEDAAAPPTKAASPGAGFTLAPCHGSACAGGTDAPALWRDAALGAAGPAAPEDAPVAGAWMALTVSPDGVTLNGAAPDRATRAAVAALAQARFAGDGVAVRLDEGAGVSAAPGWRATALATVEAAAALSEGRATMEDGVVTLTGRVADGAAARLAADRMAALGAQGWRVEAAVTTPMTASDAGPSVSDPADCRAALAQAQSEGAIRFDPGAVEPSADSALALDALAVALQRCRGLVVEVAGHTDDRGAREANMRLSARRAAAVTQALAARGVDPATLRSVGYGPDQPLADNATQAGRAANRRIAFEALAPAGDVAPAYAAPAAEAPFQPRPRPDDRG